MDIAIRCKGWEGWDILLNVARVQIKRTLIHVEYVDVCRENDTFRKEDVTGFEVESSQVEASF